MFGWDFWNKLDVFGSFFFKLPFENQNQQGGQNRLLTAPVRTGEANTYRDCAHCAIRGSSASLHESKLRTLLLMPPGLKESHCHKGLKLKKFRKGFLEVASGYGPTDGCRNTLVKREALFQLHKKEQVTIFSVLAQAELLRAHMLTWIEGTQLRSDH